MSNYKQRVNKLFRINTKKKIIHIGNEFVGLFLTGKTLNEQTALTIYSKHIVNEQAGILLDSDTAWGGWCGIGEGDYIAIVGHDRPRVVR